LIIIYDNGLKSPYQFVGPKTAHFLMILVNGCILSPFDINGKAGLDILSLTILPLKGYNKFLMNMPWTKNNNHFQNLFILSPIFAHFSIVVVFSLSPFASKKPMANHSLPKRSLVITLDKTNC